MEELDSLIGEKNLPSLFMSIAPIVIPLVLILLSTILGLLGMKNPVIDFPVPNLQIRLLLIILKR